mmetsp:Transcript_115423/g.372966  ORF Transcript_115423/g.372966 Transcript_115423/m.372966 type:complete len:96 (-) Transcript_115423:84-371(-)
MPTAGAGMHMEVSSGCSSFNGACMLPALTAVSLGTNPGESAGSNRPGDWPPPSGKGASVSADAGSAGGAGGVHAADADSGRACKSGQLCWLARVP